MKRNLLAFIFLLGTSYSVFAQTANDVCANAKTLTPSADTSCNAIVETWGPAQQESSANSCPGVAADSPSAFDVWFKFTANAAKQVVDVTTLAQGGGIQGGVGAVVTVFDACGGTQLACGNPNILSLGGFTIVQSGRTRAIADGLTPGNDYFVRVYPYGQGLPAAGRDTFEICVHQAIDPPANDLCANATTLTVEDTCSATAATLNGSSQELAPLACGADAPSNSAFDVWFQFVAEEGTQIVEVVPTGQGGGGPFGGGGLAPVIEVYTDCSGGTPIACANPTIIPGFGALPGTTILTGTAFVPAQTYFVRVYNYGDEAPDDGKFDICVHNAPPAPANDTCGSAIMLTVNDTCVPTIGTVASANQELPSVACDTVDASSTAFDVWYSFVATEATHLVDVSATGGFQNGVAAVVELYDTCAGSVLACANPQIIANFGAIAGTTAMQADGLVPGKTYYVRVYHYGDQNAADGGFTICVYKLPPPPANDTCSGAFTLVMDTVCVQTNGTYEGATQESAAFDCNGTTANTANDVWYKFVATQTDALVQVQGGSSVIGIYDACGGTLIDCANPPAGGPGGGGTTVDTLNGVTIGNTYFIRVYSSNGSQGNFRICVRELPAPEVNDECANAIQITEANSKAECSPTSVSTVNAYPSAESATCLPQPADDDVWYKFTATSVDVVAAASGKSAGLNQSQIGFTMYHLSCSGTQSTECANGAAGDSLVFRGLAIGDTYYLRTWTAGAQKGTYSICVYQFSGMPNDVCSGALAVAATNTATCTQPLAATVKGAGQENAPDACGAPDSPTANDVWFKFTAVSTTHDVEVSPVGQIGQGSVAPVVALYADNGGSCGTLITCKNPRTISFGGTTYGIPAPNKIKASGLSIGTTYFIRTYHFGATTATIPEISVCVYDSLRSNGINDLNALSRSLSVYPNPTKEKINVHLSVNSKVTMKIIGLAGQVIYSETIEKVNGDLSRSIDLSNYSKGIYTLQIVSDKESVTRKIVRE